MRVEFKRSFYKNFDKHPRKEQEKILKTAQNLAHSIEIHDLPEGLGVKLLDSTSKIWEVRVTLHTRIIFRYENNLLEFGLVGSHDQIKKYLRNFRYK